MPECPLVLLLLEESGLLVLAVLLVGDRATANMLTCASAPMLPSAASQPQDPPLPSAAGYSRRCLWRLPSLCEPPASYEGRENDLK